MVDKKILIVSTEFSPFTDIGHLGRVTSDMSAALRRAGVDVRAVIPMYRSISAKLRKDAKLVCEHEQTVGWRHFHCKVYEAVHRDVPVYLVTADNSFEGAKVYTSTENDVKRFADFCACALSVIKAVEFFPDVIQCHDWQTGFIPILVNSNEGALQLEGGPTPKTLFVLHNMKYQGICSRYALFDQFDLSSEFISRSALEFYGEVNILKGGIVFADKLVTMSESYASEIHHSYYGENLEGVIRARSADLRGIHCGIDTGRYDPMTDKTITANYDYKAYKASKAANKSHILKKLGLSTEKGRMTICFSAEILDENKGIDLIQFVFKDLMEMNINFITAYRWGSAMGEFFASKAVEFPGRVAYTKYGKELSETAVVCGSDVLLRPSRIEPCGEKHQIALRYGTLPIVRETGGLRDVVVSYNEDTNEGNGFSFANYNAHDMLYTINRAYRIFNEKPKVWDKLIKTAMNTDVSCDRTAEGYLEVYEEMTEGL